MNSDVMWLLYSHDCYMYKSRSSGNYKMSLYVPYQDMQKLMTQDFERYLISCGGGIDAIIVDKCVVVDLVHYITDWLGGDIQDYLSYADHIYYVK